MLKKRREVAEHIANHLFAAEAAIDAALTATAALSAVMPSVRSEAGLSALIGQGALESAAESLTALVRARQQMVTTHARLDEAKTQIGLRTVAVGGGMIKPAGEGRSNHLEVVDREAA
ncbi:MAG TPA: hypothetical protein VF628_09805 [Allosphingosinicella sp.]|jgi:hypothetical protein